MADSYSRAITAAKELSVALGEMAEVDDMLKDTIAACIIPHGEIVDAINETDLSLDLKAMHAAHELGAALCKMADDDVEVDDTLKYAIASGIVKTGNGLDITCIMVGDLTGHGDDHDKMKWVVDAVNDRLQEAGGTDHYMLRSEVDALTK